MAKSSLCCLSLLAAAALTAGELSVLTGVRNNTPWGHFLIEGSKAAAEGQFAEAAVAYEAGLRVLSGTSREDRLELAIAMSGLGTSYVRLGRPRDGEPLFKKSLAIWRDILGSRDILVAVALNNLADTYSAAGRHEDARRLEVEALKIDEGALGKWAALVANDLNNLGVTYAQQHKYSDAERALRRAIAIGSSTAPPHPRLSEFTGNLASLLAVLNHVDEAEQMQGRVLAMQVKERGRTHASVGVTLVRLAACEIKLKRYVTAMAHATEAIGILRARFGDRHPKTGAAYFALATVYERLKRIDLAEPAIEIVIDIDKDAVLDPSERSAHLREYAVVLRGAGKNDEAKTAEGMAAEVDKGDYDEAITRETVDLKELGPR